MADWVIWHKPSCSTSRWVLAALRDAGIAPVIRDYMADPPDAATIRAALAQAGIGARDLLRRKEPLARDLDLRQEEDPDRIIAVMAAHPILIERPLVLHPGGGLLCRPKERVAEIL